MRVSSDQDPADRVQAPLKLRHVHERGGRVLLRHLQEAPRSRHPEELSQPPPQPAPGGCTLQRDGPGPRQASRG